MAVRIAAIQQYQFISRRFAECTLRILKGAQDMFIKGMDISSYPEMLDKGHRYYDFEGNEVNVIDFAKEQGFNYGRLRIWNQPANVAESDGYCDLDGTRKLALAIKQRGMGLLLDFHYSDWWADPGQQNKPLAWCDLHGDELACAVYDYTKEVLTELDQIGAYPDMVQVGNEIRCGMLWPDGRTDNWETLAVLLNAGIRAVRDTQKGRDTKVMLHLDQGGRFYYFKEWFDNALAHGVKDFDIIGLSYYPFWHGTFYDLKYTMEELVKRYHKPLIIAEAAHAYRRSRGNLFGEAQERIAGFPAGGAAQKEILELLMSITAHISEEKGLGIFYWEPFSRPDDENDDSWGSCMGLVDEEGRPTLGIKAFGFDAYKADTNRIAKIYEPSALTVTKADEPEVYLPKTVKVLRYDGRLEREAVRWDFDTSLLHKDDTTVINGKLLQSGEPVSLHIMLVEHTQQQNLLKNADFEYVFEGVPEHWELQVESEQDSFTQEIRQETAAQFPFEATNYVYFKAESNFRFRLCQQITGLPAGRYRFSLSYRGDNTTGVKVQLYAKAMDEAGVFADIFPTADEWTRHEVELVLTQQKTVEVGIMADAPAIYGMIKEVVLSPKL